MAASAVCSSWTLSSCRRPRLKGAARPPLPDPRGREELLSPRLILEAVRKIGAAAAPEFYRTLAAASDSDARGEAAVALADAGRDELERNLPILRHLVADDSVSVRMRAAVSLLLLRQDAARQPILHVLTSGQVWERRTALEQLERVKDAQQLRFAIEALETIAAQQGLEDRTNEMAQRLLARISQQGPD